MDPSLVALEREIEELKAERRPLADAFSRAEAKLQKLDIKLERKERARDMLLGKTPIEQGASPSAKKVDIEVAVGMLLEAPRKMDKAELTIRLMKGETGQKYTKKNIGISLGVLTKPSSGKLTRTVTYSPDGKIIGDIISFGPNWPKKELPHGEHSQL